MSPNKPLKLYVIKNQEFVPSIFEIVRPVNMLSLVRNILIIRKHLSHLLRKTVSRYHFFESHNKDLNTKIVRMASGWRPGVNINIKLTF